jgi:hypothetical protein
MRATRFMLGWAALALLPLLGAGQFPAFVRHDLATFPAGYQVAVADVNADGRPDVIALSTEANRVDWFENPGWQPHAIARTERNIDLAPRDLDGDGRPELALASGFYFSESNRGGEIQLLRQPANPTNLWQLCPIAADPVVHRLRWADLDGDGQPELVHAPIFGPGSQGAADPKPSHLWAFRPPAKLAAGPWQVWKVDETLTVLHGLCVADLDRDGRDELLTASFEGVCRFDFEGKGSEGRWVKTLIAKGTEPRSAASGAPRGASEVAPGKLGNAGVFIATIEPWHGELAVVYAAASYAGPWQRIVIDDTLKEGHALEVADLDGDGRDEIIAGWRGGQGGLAVYRAADGPGRTWAKRLLDDNLPVEGAVVADLNGDGRLDLVASAGRANRLLWFEHSLSPLGERARVRGSQ